MVSSYAMRLPVQLQMQGPSGLTLEYDSGREVVSASAVLPRWDDIHFAHVYQLICKELLGPLSDRVPSTWRGPTRSPHHIFDGKMFHSLVFDACLAAAQTNNSMQIPNNAMSDIAAEEVGVDDPLPIDVHRESILRVMHPTISFLPLSNNSI